MLFVDTETCGLHGIIVLIQYAEDDGEIILYSPWLEPISETIELIEWMFTKELVGFNWAFDQFHLTKLYNVWKLAQERLGDILPLNFINEIAELEPDARAGAYCLKPPKVMDLMLHARKGPYQSTMDRKPVRIKKVPLELAPLLAEELNKRVKLKDIYFERSKTGQQWHCLDIRSPVTNDIVPGFQDVVLKFAPSSALKALAVDILDIKTVKYQDLDIKHPKGLGYAPFALAGYKASNRNIIEPRKIALPSGKFHWDWKETWPRYIKEHINEWEFNPKAIQYAKDDIVYTRAVFNHFRDTATDDLPFEMSDDDSELACMVGNVRWIGFKIDCKKLQALIKKAKERKRVPTSPKASLQYLHEVMDATEKLIITSTGGKVLEHLTTWLNEDGTPHEAALRAQDIIDVRTADKEVDLFNKLIRAGRFHASFKVIGTLSTRMAGADDLNPQGINRRREIRECFDLAFSEDDYKLMAHDFDGVHDDMHDPEQLDGGDFDGFEMTICDAAYHDPRMNEELRAALDGTGPKIHALWGNKYFFPDMSIEEILATKGAKIDKYVRCKNGVFAVVYFGEGYTLVTRVGIEEEIAEEAYHQILKDYPDFAERRRDVIDMFCSMKQPGGLGTAVEWHEPSDYIDSMLGFRRYYTLENKICKSLFDLAQKPPEPWTKLKIRVHRRADREQTACGALQSALYGAAFKIQGQNMRSAGNHRIQSTGSQITKGLERNIWNHQPVGVHPFYVKPLNVHDEVMSVNRNSVSDAVAKTVNETVEKYREVIPLISMSWKQNLKNWYGK